MPKALKLHSGYICNDTVQSALMHGNTKNKQVVSSFEFAVILRCCFVEDGYEKCQGLLNTLVQPFFCSFKNLLFGVAH